jgi:hypothetical protein
VLRDEVDELQQESTDKEVRILQLNQQRGQDIENLTG